MNDIPVVVSVEFRFVVGSVMEWYACWIGRWNGMNICNFVGYWNGVLLDNRSFQYFHIQECQERFLEKFTRTGYDLMNAPAPDLSR